MRVVQEKPENRILRRIKRYRRKFLKKGLGPGSGLWNLVWSPRLRYGTFQDPIDIVLYGLSISLDSVTFVQIGAHDGNLGDPLQPFLLQNHWRGLLVEPVEYVFRRLQEKYGGSQRVGLENVAIATENGFREFYFLPESRDPMPMWYDQIGSFSRTTILKHADQIPDLEKRLQVSRVRCLTFEDLCLKHGLSDIDLLAIDTEGSDYEILSSVDLSRYTPKILFYEHIHLSPQHQARALELLRLNGYDCLELERDTIALLSKKADENPRLRQAWIMASESGNAPSLARHR